MGVLIFAGAACTKPTAAPNNAPSQEPQGAMMEEKNAISAVPQEGMPQPASTDTQNDAMIKEGKKIVVPLSAQNNSGQSGTVTLMETPEGKIYVEIKMEGIPSSVARPVHIHKGVCPKPGEVAFPLTNIVDERSESTLSTTFAELSAMMPLAVNVHKSFAEVNVYTACGDFSAEEMKAMMKTTTGAVMENKDESTMMKKEDDVMMEKKDEGAMMKKEQGAAMEEKIMAEDSWAGSRYVTYSADNYDAAKGQKRVLFFHATWCPNCKVANQDFTDNAAKIPAGVVVLKTDYDSQTALKQRYGVTYQHTYVQVDAAGNAITKWNGGGVTELIANVK